jgi:hypothetical protein
MITLWGEEPHWSELLRQEGISFQTGSLFGGRDVVILSCPPGELHAQPVWQFVQAGGGLLAGVGPAAAVWYELHPRLSRLDWIAPDSDSPLFRNVGIVDLGKRGLLLPEANTGTTDSGTKAVLAEPTGNGFRVLLPFDVASVLARVDSGPRQFAADAPRLPYDTVAKTGRGEVRRLVANGLRRLCEHRHLPYVHLSYVPPGAGSVFGFRVDTDFGPRRDLEAVARLAERVGMKFSWYVNVGAHRTHLDLFRDLARSGHDIQLHCLRHTVYPGYQRNLANFRRARDEMAAAGIPPVGVVAPYGEWNPNLNRALEDLGFEYSSEFCLAYDDLPFRPVVEAREKKRARNEPSLRLSRVLQVPVHPICIGRLVAARATTEQMATYFHSVIDRQVTRQEPCFLYDHPERIEQYGDVLADVLAYGRERCGALTTLSDYARWWQRRERFGWNARAADGRLEIAAESADEGLRIAVEKGGQQAILPAVTGDYLLTSLDWKPLPEPCPFGPNDVVARKTDLRFRARDLLRRARKNLQGHRG